MNNRIRYQKSTYNNSCVIGSACYATWKWKSSSCRRGLAYAYHSNKFFLNSTQITGF